MIQKIKWLPRLLNKYLMKEKFRLIEKKIQLKKHPDIKMKDAIRQRAFDRFLENFLKDKVSAPYIGFEALKAGSKNYDVVVAGGDQLWIPAGLPTNFFNLMFADEKVKRVSYSTSFGVTEVPFYQKRRTIEYLNRIEIKDALDIISLGKSYRVFRGFLNRNIKMSKISYGSFEELVVNPPLADIYCTGSDQMWNSFWNNGIENCCSMYATRLV